VLSSHIGLGHAARDAALVEAMKKLLPGIEAYACTAEPALSYLRRRGVEPLPGCEEMKSLTPIVEQMYNKPMGLLAARHATEILEHNYKVLGRALSGSGVFDLIIADEYWELIYRGPRGPLMESVFVTDFLGFPTPRNPLKKLVIDRINRYIAERLARLPRLYYAGYENDVPREHRWLLRRRETRILGGLPSYPWISTTREEARKHLGLEGEKTIITIINGGTAAAAKRFLERALCLVKRSGLGDAATVLIVAGPRTREKPRHYEGIELVWVGYTPVIVDYIVAADLIISRAGRTSIADIECANRPAILAPIKGHPEQEHLARAAQERNPVLRAVPENRLCGEDAVRTLHELIGAPRTTPQGACDNALRAARTILLETGLLPRRSN